MTLIFKGLFYFLLLLSSCKWYKESQICCYFSVILSNWRKKKIIQLVKGLLNKHILILNDNSCKTLYIYQQTFVIYYKIKDPGQPPNIVIKVQSLLMQSRFIFLYQQITGNLSNTDIVNHILAKEISHEHSCIHDQHFCLIHPKLTLNSTLGLQVNQT